MAVDRFIERVAFITGGASGIGMATARRLHDEGATVVLYDRNPTALDAAVAELGGRVRGIAGDVADAEQVGAAISAAFAEFGRLDILVTAAGVDQCDTVPNTTLDEWRTIMNVDLDGVFYACRTAIPLFVEQGSGAIVAVASAIGTVGEEKRAA